MLTLFGRTVHEVMARGGFYAVRNGRQIGVVQSWAECEQLVKGFPGARYKKFETRAEADQFIAGEDKPKPVTAARPESSIAQAARFEAVAKRTFLVAPKSKTKSGISEKSESSGEPDLKKLRLIPTVPSLSSGSDDPERPVVYTDGACSGNGKNGARAGIGVYWGDGDTRNISEPLEGRPTNNRAEIHAAVTAIRQARAQGFAKVEIRTDSKFLIQSVTEWIPGWKRKGWKLASGKPVINKEDFEVLLKAQEGIDVRWTHVRGHVGIHGNEMADKLAVAGMESSKSGHDGSKSPEPRDDT